MAPSDIVLVVCCLGLTISACWYVMVALPRPPESVALETLFRGRESLDDAAFQQRYYPDRRMAAENAVRLRELLEAIFGGSMSRLAPSDNLFQVFRDADLIVVLRRIERDLGILPDRANMREVDGSFESVLRYVLSATPQLVPHRDPSEAETQGGSANREDIRSPRQRAEPDEL